MIATCITEGTLSSGTDAIGCTSGGQFGYHDGNAAGALIYKTGNADGNADDTNSAGNLVSKCGTSSTTPLNIG